MTVTINGTTGVAGVDGTASTPAIQGNDTNTGIFFPAADTIAFAEGGAEVARFDSSGNLGIGTSSPSGLSAKLAVIGGDVAVSASSLLKVIGAGYTNSLEVYNSSTGNTNISVGFPTASFTVATNSTERMRIDSSGNLQFNSGYGSVATAYGCRAWVNFNASSGTPSIRSSGNISSITDNGVGDFTLNFTTAMPDANYNVVSSSSYQLSNPVGSITNAANSVPTASAFRFRTMNTAWNANLDHEYNSLSVFR